jgi:clan AA aspartic protease
MIHGIVSERREAIVVVDVEDSSGVTHSIPAVIDTGFDGSLTLPVEALKELAASRFGRIAIILADGSESLCDVYKLQIVWDGERRVIEVDAAETAPLVGMALLEGFILNVDVVEGGVVTITRRDSLSAII